MSTASGDRTEADRASGLDPTDDDRDPVESLADEFVARRRKGERPSIEEYAARCPDRAAEIRELFPAIAAMERWKPSPTTGFARRPLVGPALGQLGDYRLIREIGRGGMGIVYEAEQASLGRRVAVKVLPGGDRVDDRPLRRFIREAKTAAGLSHPNIVPVFDAGQVDGLAYYVMPLVPGVGLDRVVAALGHRFGKTGEEEGHPGAEADRVAEALLDDRDAPGPEYWRAVARVGVQAAEALRHAHDGGILHRDVKPANILVDASGTVWVTDFGLAKAMMGHDDLSRTGDLVGTLRYLAPERFRGVDDARGDVFGLGLTLLELLTFRPARPSNDRVELVRRVAEGRTDAPIRSTPGVPRDLETAVLKAIEPDPAARYASAGALADDLARFLDGRAVLARRAGPAERLARWAARNRLVAALALTSVALGLVAAVFIVMFLKAPPPPPRRPGDPPPIGGPRPGDPPWPPPPRRGFPPPD